MGLIFTNDISSLCVHTIRRRGEFVGPLALIWGPLSRVRMPGHVNRHDMRGSRGQSAAILHAITHSHFTQPLSHQLTHTLTHSLTHSLNHTHTCTETHFQPFTLYTHMHIHTYTHTSNLLHCTLTCTHTHTHFQPASHSHTHTYTHITKMTLNHTNNL